MKRAISMIVMLLILISVLPITVFANMPVAHSGYWFEFTNLPDGTVYADLLVKLPEKDPRYVTLVEENLPEGFTESSQILSYCEDDFRSYTFHYADAASMIKLSEENYVFFFQRNMFDLAKTEHMEDINKRGDIRVALLDESGNIIQVSKTFSVRPKHIAEYSLNTFWYDASADTLDRNTIYNNAALLLFFALSVGGVLLTCLLESLVARGFGLTILYGKLILHTNFVSQILMRFVHVFLYGWVFNRYVWTVAFLEVLVYTGEFLIYRRKMITRSTKEIFWYTVTANSVSLVLSIIPMMIF